MRVEDRMLLQSLETWLPKLTFQAESSPVDERTRAERRARLESVKEMIAKLKAAAAASDSGER